MLYIKTATTTLCLVALSGCSTFSKVQNANTEFHEEPQPKVEKCRRTQANLMVSYQERMYREQYVCVTGEYKDYKKNFYYQPQQRAIESIEPVVRVEQREEPYFSGVVETVDTVETIQTFEPVVESIEPLKVETLGGKKGFTYEAIDDSVSNTQSFNGSADGSAPHVIPFASFKDTLGPKGKSATAKAASVIIQYGKDGHIYIQPVLSIRHAHKEKALKDLFSVGRAISVKNALRRNGVKNKITILNRDSNRYHYVKEDGDYVEIYVD